MEEKKVGEIIKFFGKISVAAIRLSEGSLKVGDTIHIVGHTTESHKLSIPCRLKTIMFRKQGRAQTLGSK